jgi:hypothetical protein
MVFPMTLPPAVICYVHPDYVRAEFMASMLTLQRAAKTPIEAILHKHSGPLIASARNDLVSLFLNERKSDWLWMVDTDMIFTGDTLDRLLAAALDRDVKIMGGLCFADFEAEGVRPTLYETIQDETGRAGFVLAWYNQWPEDQVMEVGATGAACLLVHRDVFTRVAAGWQSEKVDRTWPWFRESTNGNRRVGEDVTFCLRARVRGFTVNVHTGVKVGHMKSRMIGEVG